MSCAEEQALLILMDLNMTSDAPPNFDEDDRIIVTDFNLLNDIKRFKSLFILDNMQLHDYYCKLRYKTCHFYSCYHT